MSTTFGVKIDNKYLNYSIHDDGIDDDICPIAHRSNGIRFINPIAHLLPDNTPVVPMDNDAQGIFTIGDIKKEIYEQT